MNDYVTESNCKDDVREMKEAFDMFDADGNGTLDLSEIKAVMKDLKLEGAEKFILQRFREVDVDNSGEIDFQEFVIMLDTKINSTTSRKELQGIFNELDLDKTGDISLKNCMELEKELGTKFTKEEFEYIIRKNDVSKNGRWTFEDFYTVMTAVRY